MGKLLPESWVSDPHTRKAGALRRWLKQLGATWLSSPLRRIIQGLCFILFLWFFFYSCWPYRAQPAPVWKGWIPVEIDAETGRARLTADDDLRGLIRERAVLHVFEGADQGHKAAYLGPFIVGRVEFHPMALHRGSRSEEDRGSESGIRSQASGVRQNVPSARGSGEASVPSAAANSPERLAESEGKSRQQEPAKTGFTTVLQLHPQQKMTPEALENLSISTGPWTLSTEPPDQWPSHYADEFAARDRLPVESFLLIDPLVSISTALAAKAWMWSLWGAAIILAVCVFIPRGFCGYLCPLGTLIDLFDWAIAGRVKRFRVSDNGWWVHLKYYLLFGVLVAGLCGVLLSGFVSAIPVLTRGLLFLLAPLQLGFLRGWHQVPALDLGQFLSIALFFAVLGLGFLRPRFWCKYVCPSGAVFSLGNLFRVSERKVEDTCIHCNKCVEICPFDAIKPDFTTRVTDCTLCQTCGGVCPTHAIKFVERSNRVSLKAENDPPTGEHTLAESIRRLWDLRFTIGDWRALRWVWTFVPRPSSLVPRIRDALRGRRLTKPEAEPHWPIFLAEKPIARRSFMASGLGLLAGLTGGGVSALATKTFGARLNDPVQRRPVRPPGSVPEKEFLELCIRCGECFKVCPNSVLQPLSFQQGLEGLWTPQVVADWAGCEPSCNACGKACPTGAIRALPLEEKKAARMGLAVVNEKTCLPWAGQEACQLCVDECVAAGYEAIEFIRVHSVADSSGKPVEGTGFLAPKVQADKCVGCGLCQTRCYSINAKTKRLLAESAILIEAGEGKEDRMMSGSYRALKTPKNRGPLPAARETNAPQQYLPSFLEPRAPAGQLEEKRF